MGFHESFTATEFDFEMEMQGRKANSKALASVMRKHTITPPPSNRQDRTSFASFKEDRNAIAQSFIDSKTSSYARAGSEDAIEDSSSEHHVVLEEPHHHQLIGNPGISLTNPSSALHGFICPCEGFRDWKQISVGGKLASRSFSDLTVLSKGFSWKAAEIIQPELQEKKSTARNEPGKSQIERLPMELLGTIIDQLTTDTPPNGCTPRNTDLMSLLLTSRALHSATLASLYNQITIPHSRVFRKFLTRIAAHPSLGTIVRRMDFSHFNPIGAEMTARQRAESQNLTPKTLLECLELLPNLREFLAQEHIDGDMNADVIRKLLSMSRLQAIDFCACSSGAFRESMMTVFRSSSALDIPSALSITRLSLHECAILPAAVFESLLPRLPRLTHLDLTHTRVTDTALASIPNTARLTHLSLSKCSSLSGEAVVDFLSKHPAARSLVYLNLLMDAKSHEMLSAVDITALLPNLPSTLKSLNLKGSSMNKNHVAMLSPLSKHLQELGVGRNIPYEDIATLLHAPEAHDDEDQKEEMEEWTPHTLRYLDISDLEPAEVDLSSFFHSRTSILKTWTVPLEVVEVGSKLYDRLKDRDNVFKSFGWVVKEAGRRGWLVRDMGSLETKGQLTPENMDNGSREWKMGAVFWGMRKVPVAAAEVGGMYGLYMFKR